MFKATLKGLTEFKNAIQKNTAQTRTELNRFFIRGLAVYRKGIKNDPWRIGQGSGGAPVAAIRGGFLRDSHVEKIEPYRATITPTSFYAVFVHEGTMKMKKRPWLDWVKESKQREIDKLLKDLMDNILKNLAI